MLNMNERMNESLFNLNYKIINIVRLFNFTRSAILPHNLPKLYSTGRFSWSTICYCAGGRGLKVLNGTRPVEYTVAPICRRHSDDHNYTSAELTQFDGRARGDDVMENLTVSLLSASQVTVGKLAYRCCTDS